MDEPTAAADPRVLSAEEIALIGTWLDARGAMGPDLADDFIALLAHSAALLERIEALEGENAWRPIESAPKDGTWVLLYCPRGNDTDDEYKIAFWSDRTYVGGTEIDFHAGDWFSWEGANNAIHFQNQPTHWRPLPTPPGAQS